MKEFIIPAGATITPEMIDKAGAYLDNVLETVQGTGKGYVEEILAIFQDFWDQENSAPPDGC